MRTLSLVLAVSAAVLASQAPEFSQQYRQRLGGALAELSAVRADFLRDAERSGLSPSRALVFMSRSPIAFIRDRGASMERTLARHDRLARQSRELDAAVPALRPLAVLSATDGKILRDTWASFVPAVPVDPAGLIWTLLGASLGLLVGGLFQPARHAKRKRRRVKPVGRVLLSEG